MKKITKILFLFIATLPVFYACSDMLDTDYDGLAPKDNLDSPNDSLYYLTGIMKEMKAAADRYVLLGELRGDLLDVTANSDLDMIAINNFTATAKNKYVTDTAYYKVINLCNYYLQRVDTNIMAVGVKPMLREYAAVKAMRAWTYMQIALNYGTVSYYEEPLLEMKDLSKIKNLPQYDYKGLAEVLIKDLEPLEDVDIPRYGSFALVDSKYLFIPIKFLLGDLNLWLGEYEKAAGKYYDLIYEGSLGGNPGYKVSAKFTSRWMNNLTYSYYDGSLMNSFMSAFVYTGARDTATVEVVSILYNASDILTWTYPSLTGEGESNATFEYKLKPSSVALNNWLSQDYLYYNSTSRLIEYVKGDLRGYGSSYDAYKQSLYAADSTVFVTKYSNNVGNSQDPYHRYNAIFLCRVGLLYLRYAEAVNLAGKPTLALAVLKNGLNAQTLNNSEIVDPAEIDPLPYYCNFRDTRFASNIGIRSRGVGASHYDTIPGSRYVIPAEMGKVEAISYVDELICDELALETAFEGNRFQDLMRFAIRRNDPSFLADRVAKKHNNDAAIRAKLMNKDNWYLPTK